ncbi:hypothetical protein [Lentzea californiensis]|uniref:hypothetical protein n=1 Tax=Lentzea californiensis TaxID=438851 RepID=UPI002165E889|nr:hypothetical protein [Lentzea californiensis]
MSPAVPAASGHRVHHDLELLVGEQQRGFVEPAATSRRTWPTPASGRVTPAKAKSFVGALIAALPP